MLCLYTGVIKTITAVKTITHVSKKTSISIKFLIMASLNGKAIIASVILLGNGVAGNAAVVSDSTEILFRQGAYILDTTLSDNGTRLKAMIQQLNADTDSAMRIRSIRVTGSASPEGPVTLNRRLSQRRADEIFSYFSARTDLPESKTEFYFTGRDWNGLAAMVRDDVNVPDRDKVMALLDEIPDRLLMARLTMLQISCNSSR